MRSSVTRHAYSTVEFSLTSIGSLMLSQYAGTSRRTRTFAQARAEMAVRGCLYGLYEVDHFSEVSRSLADMWRAYDASVPQQEYEVEIVDEI